MTSVKGRRSGEHPAWCRREHRDDEPHYGPCADAEVANIEGEGLLICFNGELDGREELSIIPLTDKPIPLVGPIDTGQMRFTLAQAIGLRDAINRVLAEVTGAGNVAAENPAA
ncbi:hypothetical protein [Actinocorallia sp. A-T 12471]|uniref:hypothetical protein n=1 Tax=Actinocorallia sp. A-T 12471 TaxID=3089813 RepID=UPI0029CEF0F5|nr:hypothetical protein [Actinocorallia sp. A-T 12471]MDX6745088.1 hypothetical protein [Actinocorallia sp. A-T 12471]